MRIRSRKKRRRWGGLLFLVLLVAGVLLLRGPLGRSRRVLTPGRGGEEPGTALLEVAFLDVGQGNAVFVRSGKHTMLVDGGPAEASSSVVRFLKNQGVEGLDYVIATHYDADHISGLIGVLHTFSVGRLLAPGYEADTRTYRSFLQMRRENGCPVTAPERGETYSLGEAAFTVVTPAAYDSEGDNNNSIGIRLVCGETSFLLLGDAEGESETSLLESGLPIRSDVYLVSHHGSAGSSGTALLEAVRPAAAVISCGRGNDFGHPSERTLERLKAQGVLLYRTDIQGDITAVSDGERIRFLQEPCNDFTPGDRPEENRQIAPPRAEGYIGNVHSLKFHRPDCDTLPAEQNRVYFSTRQEAVEAGYSPCGFCRP